MGGGMSSCLGFEVFPDEWRGRKQGGVGIVASSTR